MVVWCRGLRDKAKLYFYVQTYHRREFPALGAYGKFDDATNRYSVELPALLSHSSSIAIAKPKGRI
jgi:hypothetical protein